MAAPAFLFCTVNDLKAYLSETGFMSRADDDNSGSIDGTVSSVPWTRSGTTITATYTSHGLLVGDSFTVSVSSDTSAVPLGTYTVLTATATTFTFTGVNAGGASGTLSYPRTNEQAGIDLAINLGTLEVCKYIQRRYLPAQLATSELIKYFAVVFSCAALCRRRGNGVPESLAEELDLIISQLEDIRDGKLDVPDISERAPRGPLIVNLRADARYPRPMRRQDSQSSNRGAKSHLGRDYSDMVVDPK